MYDYISADMNWCENSDAFQLLEDEKKRIQEIFAQKVKNIFGLSG